MNETVTGTHTSAFSLAKLTLLRCSVKHGCPYNHFALKYCRRGSGCQGRSERRFLEMLRFPQYLPKSWPLPSVRAPCYHLTFSITVFVVSSFLSIVARFFHTLPCLLYRPELHVLQQRDANIQWPEIRSLVSFSGNCLAVKAALSPTSSLRDSDSFPTATLHGQSWAEKTESKDSSCSAGRWGGNCAHDFHSYSSEENVVLRPRLTAGSWEMWFLVGQTCAQEDRIKGLWSLRGTITSLPHILYPPSSVFPFRLPPVFPLSASPFYLSQP